MAKKLCENRLRWFGNAERSEDQHESGWIQQRFQMGGRWNGRHGRRRADLIKDDLKVDARQAEWTPRTGRDGGA